LKRPELTVSSTAVAVAAAVAAAVVAAVAVAAGPAVRPTDPAERKKAQLNILHLNCDLHVQH